MPRPILTEDLIKRGFKVGFALKELITLGCIPTVVAWKIKNKGDIMSIKDKIFYVRRDVIDYIEKKEREYKRKK